MYFISNIKRLMKEKRITAKQIEVTTGISSRTLAKARSDGGILECRLSTLIRIANALDVDVKVLFENTEQRKEEVKNKERGGKKCGRIKYKNCSSRTKINI